MWKYRCFFALYFVWRIWKIYFAFLKSHRREYEWIYKIFFYEKDFKLFLNLQILKILQRKNLLCKTHYNNVRFMRSDAEIWAIIYAWNFLFFYVFKLHSTHWEWTKTFFTRCLFLFRHAVYLKHIKWKCCGNYDRWDFLLYSYEAVRFWRTKFLKKLHRREPEICFRCQYILA